MRLLLLFTLLISLPLIGHAQFAWDGGAGTTNWQDAANWSSDMVPPAGSLVQIGLSTVITGSANSPSQISITNGADVTLNLDMVIGNNIVPQDALVVNANSRLAIATGRIVFVQPPSTNEGVAIGAGADNAVFEVETGASLLMQSPGNGILVNNSTASVINAGDIAINSAAANGIQLSAGSFENTGNVIVNAPADNGIRSTGSFENSGTINISGSSNRGIFNRTGSFENNGSITITDAGSVGIRDLTGEFSNNQQITINNPGATTNDGIRTDGNFINGSGGSITVNEVNGDGVAISNGTLTNNGSLDVTVPAASSGGKDGISIASTATLDNNGTVTVDGLGASARLVRVEGTLSNSGIMTLSGGIVNGRMLVSGNVTNEIGGELDMGDGRIDLNDGSLTNDGLISSSHTLAGVFLNTGSPVATNNGFFDYTNGNLFTRGNMGSSTDNGIDLNDPTETTINAGGSCTVNIANADGYDYFDGSTLVGTSGVSGETPLSNLSSTTMVTLTNGLTGVEIIIENVCAAALPITLTSFTAAPKGDEVMVEWETATELNNDYMAVERSADGRRFEEIGRVAGAGNSNTPIRYALTDDQPLPGLSYYRLRQVDFDGTTSYSDVRSVNLQSAAGGSIRVDPTVSNGKTPLTLTLPSVGQRGDVALDIFHASGALVHSVRLPLGRQQQLQLPTLSPGTYIIKSRDERLKMAGRFVVLR